MKWLPSGRLWTLILILLGVVSYAAFALLTGALTKADLAPFTRRIGRKKNLRRKKGNE